MSLDKVMSLSWLSLVSLGAAVVATLILLWFLLLRPKLGRGTKVALAAGIGLFPIASAFTGNIAGYERTMERGFCGACHTMGPYVADAADGESQTLAAVHSRNNLFGGHSCYTCHEDYGMFGTIVTKMAGMKHVWLYYTEFRNIPVEEAMPRIHLYKPYPNGNCMQCHSTRTPRFGAVPEHEAAADLITSGELSCAGAGCHGPVHPFSKVGRPEEETGEAKEGKP